MEWKPVHGKRRGVIRQVNAPRVNWMASRLFAALLLVVTPLTAVAEAQHNPQQLYAVDLPPQTIAESLNQLARQTGAQFLFPYQLANAIAARPVNGHFTLLQATQNLLYNTGLSSDLVDGVLTISPTYCEPGETGCDPNNLYGHTDESTKGKRMNIKNSTKRKTLLASLIGVFAAGGMTQAVAQGGEAATGQSAIDEIIVTSTRRATSLNDTAVSIAAIGGEEIARRNLTEMNDYLRAIPGVNLMDTGVSQNSVTIRGLTIDPQNSSFNSSPTVGIYLGEISLGGLALRSGSADLRMIDLERVEVLRGPQGTLFGSSSLGGAVRNIPVAPNLQEVQGSFKTGYSNTAKFGGDNTKFEGVVNIPLIEDTLGIRAVAYRHHNSGFIKNIAGTQLATNGLVNGRAETRAADAVANYGGSELYQNKDDLGNSTYTGGRISALWKPSEEFSLSIQYIKQEAEQEGWPYQQINIGKYVQVSHQFGNNIPILSAKEQGLTDDISITHLVAEYDFGWATGLSLSAWMEEDGARYDDISFLVGGSPLAQPWTGSTEAFTQEFRLVSQLEGPLQYVVGLYYEDNETLTTADAYATSDLSMSIFLNPVDPTDPQIIDQFFDRTLEQKAFYGELSYELSDEFTLTVGGRRFDYERAQRYFLSGAVGNNDAPGGVEETGTNFKANLSYKPNDDTLLYAQWAEGFRLGNATVTPPSSACDVDDNGTFDGTDVRLDDSFDADSTENFEIGAKLTLLDSRLQLNAAAYRIDWQDIPLIISPPPGPPCFSSFTDNVGDARSQGVEIEMVYQLSEDFRMNLGGAFTDAELTGVVPGVPFSVGDRLPGAPEYSFNFGLEHDFEVANYPLFIRLDYAFVGKYYARPGETGGLGNPTIGDYGQINLNAGIEVENFTFELTAQNLANEDALTHVSVFTSRGESYRLRPRTVGLNATYKF